MSSKTNQKSFLDTYFNVSESKSTVKTEILAGITTFITMAYILFVNPTTLGGAAGSDQVTNGVFIATCISSFIGTIIMGCYAKLPFALAPGMGINAFFAYTVILGYGYTYSQALAIVFISGILFIAITVFGIREQIVKAIPKNIKVAISVGIGLFLAFLGFQDAHIIVANKAVLVGLVDFSKITDPELHGQVIGAIIAIIGVFIIAALHKLRVKGSIIIGIVVCTVLGIVTGAHKVPEITMNYGQKFKDFSDVSFLSFGEGLKSLLGNGNILKSILMIFILVISFSIVDLFDTIGTLLGTAKRANLLDEKGEMPGMKKALMSDALATTIGAMFGTSTVTTYVESGAGIAEGGRTGLTASVTAILFLAALVLAPFTGVIPSFATAPALIFVGCLMISSVTELELEDMSEAVPAFLTIVLMPLAYSISTGICFGLISYVVIKLLSGKIKEVNIVTAILAIVFIVRMFILAV